MLNRDWEIARNNTRNVFTTGLKTDWRLCRRLSDQNLISPCNIDRLSSRRVMRINKIINLKISSWCTAKFSEPAWKKWVAICNENLIFCPRYFACYNCETIQQEFYEIFNIFYYKIETKNDFYNYWISDEIADRSRQKLKRSREKKTSVKTIRWRIYAAVWPRFGRFGSLRDDGKNYLL